MKILKIKKGKNKYKVRCNRCYSKLLLHFEDIKVEILYGGDESARYKCPVCKWTSYLLNKNRKNYFAYKRYQDLLKKEDKTNG